MKSRKKNETKKTQVFNVIILDRSGSMERIRQAAVDGFNETLAGIKNAQKKFSDTQDHYVSLVTFCDCDTQHVFDMTPVQETRPLRIDEYIPCCGTPLYDAMGFTLTALHKKVKDMADAVVVVTIITDGMENASKEYTGKTIKNLAERLRNEGWTFTYMGANQDAVEVASEMSIRNARNFEHNALGAMASMQKDSNTRMNFFARLSRFKEKEAGTDASTLMSVEERRNLYSSMADAAFDEEENNS